MQAWYGGPENHGGGKVYDLHENVPWLWQEGHRKGKIVTDIVRRSLRDGVLDFNPERRGCNGIFEFGHDWGCWKVLAVQYRYGDGPIKTWLSPSDPNEPYSLRLGAGGGGVSRKVGGGGGSGRITNAGLNGPLNDAFRNTNDTARIRRLVRDGADLTSTNGQPWNHTGLHQASLHNRPEVVRVVTELAREQGLLTQLLAMDSNPSGRGGSGRPIELASPHPQLQQILREAEKGGGGGGATGGGGGAPQPMGVDREGGWSASYPRISTGEIAGKWTCCCIPGGWACFEKVAQSEDQLEHHGCVCLFFGIPCPFDGEIRRRKPNTNNFYKVGEEGNVDSYLSPGCVCNGISCSVRLC